MAILNSRFTYATAEGVRKELMKLTDGQLQKYLKQLGEPESPSERREPKVERLVQGWLGGRVRDLDVQLGLSPTEKDLRRRYGV